MGVNILHAGYGTGNQTINATGVIQQAYAEGTRNFMANNDWVGDPAEGITKSLFIVWEENGNVQYGVTSESDADEINLP